MKLLHLIPLFASVSAVLATFSYEEDYPPHPLVEKFDADFGAGLRDFTWRVDQNKGINWTHAAIELKAWHKRAVYNQNIWLAAVSAKAASKTATQTSTTAQSVLSNAAVVGTPLSNGAGTTTTNSNMVVTTSSPSATTQTTTTNSGAMGMISDSMNSSPTTTGTSATSTDTSSTASAPSSTPSQTTDTVDQELFTTLTNNFRAQYGAGPLLWNETLAAYAYKAASTCKYGHTGGPYGENIAAGVGGGYDVTAGFTSWSSESKLYNWAQPGYSEATGHFTQIVWKGTTQLGCAAVSCADNTIFQNYGQNSLYLVCEYAEPGNWVDPSDPTNTAAYFTDNVGTYTG